MKFLNILKEYNNAIIKENKRLKSIYNTLLRESEDDLECVDETDDDVLNDCVISEKDDVESKECDDSGCNESEFDEMLEASKKDSSAEDDADNVDENDLMLASEFFRECDGSQPEDGEVTTEDDEEAAGKMTAEEFLDVGEAEEDLETESEADEVAAFFNEDEEDEDTEKKDSSSKKKKSSDDDLMSAEEFFGSANEDEKTDDEPAGDTNEDDLMSKDKLINGSSKNSKRCVKEGEKKLVSASDIFTAEAEEDQKSDDEDEAKPEPKKEDPDKSTEDKPSDKTDDDKDDDKALAESLREYRRNNAHLFND